jgi:hypothetical protein
MVIGDDDTGWDDDGSPGMPGAGMMLYVQNCCRNQTAVQTVKVKFAQAVTPKGDVRAILCPRVLFL